MKKFLASITILTMLIFAGTAAQAQLINPDFETGDFTGWTLFTTTSGTLGPTPNPLVEPFDTNNDSTATNSARFQVGHVATSGSQAGGGIYQSVTTGSGPLSISVDIASFDSTTGTNASGGVFSLLLDGATLDIHDFGPSIPSGTEYSTLFGNSVVTAGSHEIRILMTRPYTASSDGVTPYQYLDNIVLNGEIDENPVIPEPMTASLLGTGLLGLIGFRKRS